MSNPSDFVIENGVLKKYKGSGGNVVIPDGVTSIGHDAFYNCSSLTSVTIPDSVVSISSLAFHRCNCLTSVTIPDSVSFLGYEAFSDCDRLERVEILGSLPKTETNVFEGCQKLSISLPRGVGKTSSKLPTVFVKAVKTMDEEELAWVLLFQTAKAWQTEAIDAAKQKNAGRILQVQLEQLQGMKKPRTAVAENAVNTCLGLSRKAPEAAVKALAEFLRAKECAKQLSVLEQDPVLQEKLIGKERALQSLDPAERAVAALLEANGMSQKDLSRRLQEFMGVKSEELQNLLRSAGKSCKPFVLSWLLTAHETMCVGPWGQNVVIAEYKDPGLCPKAAEIVGLLDPDSLQAAIMKLADDHLYVRQNGKQKFLAYPFCRYANEANMAELTKRAPKWATSVSGNDAPPLRQLRDAVKFSNTRAAMLFAERYGELDEYAKLRGMTEDELRDKYLSDLGLDEHGGKAYDLGNQTVTARLQKDLSFLFELPNGKTAKSLPKKGAEPAKYDASKTDFDEMRKAVKKILKSRGNVLFGDFLSGRARESGEWQEAYVQNPLLRLAAGLLVWEQGGKTFTLTDAGAIDCSGTPYAITDAPIKVAHPMEMGAEELAAWQRYFNARGLKQPFAQVWEPVIDPKTIKEDRYAGSVQPMYRFGGKDKHGIHSGNLHAYSEDIGFTLDGCRLEYEASTWRINPWDKEDAAYSLGKFTFDRYTRQVNHIVSLLDRWTVEDRVRKDDVSVMELMDDFTFAQITEFVAAAQEAQAVNVLALLLEYKNAHFADFDPMDEFTLEW